MATPNPSSRASVATLLGHTQMETALLCLASLRRLSTEHLSLRLHDDGTLTAEDLARLAATLGEPEVVRRIEADPRVETELARYPYLRSLRKDNVLGLKLLDVILLSGDELLYCDSDVLFLRSFTDLFQHQVLPEGAVFMADRQNAYSLRSWSLARHPQRLSVVRRLNSGIVRYPRSAFDLDRLDWLVRRDELKHTPVWLEQTCWAALAATLPCRLLDERQLVIPQPGLPLPAECVGAHFVSAVRGELARWVDWEPPEKAAVGLRSSPAHRCHPFDLAASEARRAFRRLFSS